MIDDFEAADQAWDVSTDRPESIIQCGADGEFAHAGAASLRLWLGPAAQAAPQEATATFEGYRGDTKIWKDEVKTEKCIIRDDIEGIGGNPDREAVTRPGTVTGEIFPKSDETASQEVVSQLRESDPNVFALPLKPEPPAPLLARSVDRLIVLNDLDNDAKGPFDWTPLSGSGPPPSPSARP